MTLLAFVRCAEGGNLFSLGILQALEPLSLGCIILVMKEEDRAQSSFDLVTTTLESTSLALVAWRGRKNINLLVTKQDAEYITSQFKVMGLYVEKPPAADATAEQADEALEDEAGEDEEASRDAVEDEEARGEDDDDAAGVDEAAEEDASVEEE